MREPPTCPIRQMRAEDLDAVSAIESAVQRFPWRRRQFEDALRAGYQAWVLLAPPTPDARDKASGTAAEPPLGRAGSSTHDANRVPADAGSCAGASDVVIGHAILMPVVDEIELLSLAVAANWQGRGLGRCWLGWLQSRARLGGMQSMLLEVAAGNAPALSLYRRAGFQRIGQRRAYYRRADGQQDDAWVMRCRLDEAPPPADGVIHVLD